MESFYFCKSYVHLTNVSTSLGPWTEGGGNGLLMSTTINVNLLRSCQGSSRKTEGVMKSSQGGNDSRTVALSSV